jgi:hypothetical protein
MKEPLFRSTKTTRTVITLVMFGLLGLSLAAAYAITLRPPKVPQSRRVSPQVPVTTTAPSNDEDEDD